VNGLRLSRLFGVGLLGLVLALATTAVVDHHVKQRRMNQAELMTWYCIHQGTECGGPSVERIEARWNQRQLAYECGVAFLASAGLLCLTLPVRTRRSDSREPSRSERPESAL